MFGRKKKPQKPKQEIIVSEAERVELVDQETGIEYDFYIGQDQSGTWLAFTQHSILKDAPHFLIECDDKEDAFTVGVLAYRSHYALKGTK